MLFQRYCRLAHARKLLFTGVVVALGATASAPAMIIDGTGTFLLVGEEVGQDLGSWGIDGHTMSLSILLGLESILGDDPYNVEAVSEVSLNDVSGNLELAVTPGNLVQIFSQGIELSDAAGLTFSSTLYSYAEGSGGSTDLDTAKSQAFGSAAEMGMAKIFPTSSGNGIMGFRYSSGGKTNYDWANVVWDGTWGSFSLGIDNVTGSTSEGILAGTTSEIPAVPEPTTTGLVLGAVALGFVLLRRLVKN